MEDQDGMNNRDRLYVFLGKIRTLDPSQPLASGLVVVNDRIEHLGTAESCQRFVNRFYSTPEIVIDNDEPRSLSSSISSSTSPFPSPSPSPSPSSPSSSSSEFPPLVTEVLIPPYAVMMPSFHDSHMHPAAGGLQLIQCNLRTASNLQEALQLIAIYAETLDPGDDQVWLTGGGWPPSWFENLTPTASLLDSVCPHHPAYLRDVNGHELWTNTLGLKRAGIFRDTPDPPHGEIKRDEDGEPVGHLLEQATRLVARVLPNVSDQLRDRGLDFAVQQLLKNGVTSVHDAAVTPNVFSTYLRALRDGRLKITVHIALQWQSELTIEQNMQYLCARRDEARAEGGDLLFAETVKIFLDGLPENCTAAMHQPYKRVPPAHHHPWNGVLNYSAEHLAEMLSAICQAGFQAHIHCLGDAAVTRALDAFSTLPKSVRLRCRNIIAHIQFVSSSDLRRFRELDVMVNMSPFWFQEAEAEIASENVGFPRARDQYPCKKAISAGAFVCFGSDWPVSSLVPLEGIQVAVTRCSLHGSIQESDLSRWNFEEAISIEEAFSFYTSGSARAGFREHEIGMIKEGYLADLIILDMDPFEVATHHVSKCKILKTISRGIVLYEHSPPLYA
jgi:hypothetical protein